MRATRAVQGKPQLQPAALNGADGAVGTVVSVEFRESSASEKKEKRFVLAFKEFPENEFWVNKEGQNALIDHFGDETAGWMGKVVPLVTDTVTMTRGKNAGQTYHVVKIAAALWDTVLKAYAPAKPATRAGRGK